MTSDTTSQEQFDVDKIRHALETDGIIARKGAFAPEWVQEHTGTHRLPTRQAETVLTAPPGIDVYPTDDTLTYQPTAA